MPSAGKDTNLHLLSGSAGESWTSYNCVRKLVYMGKIFSIKTMLFQVFQAKIFGTHLPPVLFSGVWWPTTQFSQNWEESQVSKWYFPCCNWKKSKLKQEVSHLKSHLIPNLSKNPVCLNFKICSDSTLNAISTMASLLRLPVSHCVR